MPRWPAWAPWLLAVLVIGLYAPTLSFPYVFDDAEAVVNNASLRHWRTAFAPPPDGGTTTGRPLLNASFALTQWLGRGAPWAHRLGNVLLHAAAAGMLFAVGRRTLALAAGADRANPGAAAPAALALALVWAVHPLQTESVTGIAQRSEVLCGVLLLAVLLAFLRGVAAEAPGASRRWLGVSVGACAAGMAAKEVMAVAPLLVLLHDRTFVAGSFAAAWRARRGYYLALAATWLVLAGLLAAGGGTRGVSAGLGLGVSPWHYLLTQAGALVHYDRLVFWPHPLVVDYGTGVVTAWTDVGWQSLVVVAALAGTGWALVRRPRIGFLGAWFFLLLAPSSSVIPLVAQTVAEHRMYLPLAAVLAAAGLAAGRWGGARLAGPGLVVVTAAAATLTVMRNEDYRTPLALWMRTVADYPENPRAHLNLGVEQQRAGRPAEALMCFEAALARRPDYVAAWYGAGSVLLELGRVDEAVVRLREAVRLGPAHADAQLALGNALVRAGEAVAALPHYVEAARLRPAADVSFNLGLALESLGRRAEAEAAWREAVRQDPGLVVAHRRLGLQAARAGRLAEAGEHFAAIVRVEPADAEALANLGNVRLLQGRAAEAVGLYEQVLRLRPGDARVLENLAVARQALR